MPGFALVGHKAEGQAAGRNLGFAAGCEPFFAQFGGKGITLKRGVNLGHDHGAGQRQGQGVDFSAANDPSDAVVGALRAGLGQGVGTQGAGGLPVGLTGHHHVQPAGQGAKARRQ